MSFCEDDKVKNACSSRQYPPKLSKDSTLIGQYSKESKPASKSWSSLVVIIALTLVGYLDTTFF